jgi:ribosome-associated translation inhibitor RaiA
MARIPVDPRHPFRHRIRVVLCGALPPVARGWALDEVERAVTHEPLPLRFARVSLRHFTRIAPACRADITVNLGGHLLHGRGEAADPRDALHRAAERIRTQARGLAARRGPFVSPTTEGSR